MITDSKTNEQVINPNDKPTRGGGLHYGKSVVIGYVNETLKVSLQGYCVGLR